MLLFGDSHIEQYGPRAVEIARQGGPASLHTLLFATKGGCPPIPNVFEDRNVDCDSWRSDIIDYIHSTKPDAVVIGGCWNCYFIKQAVANPDGNYDEGYYYRDRLTGNRKYAFRGGGEVAPMAAAEIGPAPEPDDEGQGGEAEEEKAHRPIRRRSARR